MKINIVHQLLIGTLLFVAFFFGSYHLLNIYTPATLFQFPLDFTNGILQYIIIGLCGFSFCALLLTKEFKYYISLVDIVFILLLLYSYYTINWSPNLAFANAAVTLQISIFVCFIIFKSSLLSRKGSTLKTIHFLVIIFGLIVISYFLFKNAGILADLISSNNNNFQILIKKTRSMVGPKNQYGWFLVIIMYVTILSYQKLNFKYLASIFLALTAINMILMGSRNAYLSFAVFVVLFVILNKPSLKTLGKYALGLLVFLVTFALFIGPSKFLDQITHQTFSSRLKIWQKSLELFHGEPIYGIGIGQYGNYRTLVDLDKIIQPHNDFIRYLIETGIIGTSLYGMLLAILIYKCIKIRRSHTESKIKTHANILLAVILAIISLSIFDEIKFKLNHQILIVLIWAMTEMYSKKENLNNIHKYICCFILCISSFSLLFYSYKFIQTQNALIEIRKNQNANPANRLASLLSINQNYISHFNQSPVNTSIADIYYTQNEFSKAQSLYEASLKIDPGNKTTIEKYIECSFQEDNFINSIPYIFQILDEDPCNINYQNKLSIASPFVEEKEIISNYKKLFRDKCL